MYGTMFNIDFEDKRVKSFLRTLQYLFLTLLVVAGTVLLVFAGQGYDIDRNTGEVIKNGLMLVNSSPEGAQVKIDGKPESDLTPGRFSLPEGEYDVELNLDGYLPWQKRVKVVGSSVEWIYYPLLFPAKLASVNVIAVKNVEFASSMFGDRFLVRYAGDDRRLKLFEVSGEKVIDEQDILLPEQLYEGKAGSFKFVEVASDNRHVLLEHTSPSAKKSILWVDLEQPDKSRNLTREFDISLSEVRFIKGDSQQIYALTGNDLRQINLSDKTISAPIAANIESYALYEDKYIVYVASGNKPELVLLADGYRRVFSRNLPAGVGRVQFEYANFDGDFHLVMLDTVDGEATIFFNPQDDKEISQGPETVTMKLAGADSLSISPNGQFAAIQSQKSFVVYDFDTERIYRFKADGLDTAYAAKWLDGFRFYAYTTSGVVTVFEFDGANRHDLIKADSRLPIIEANDGKLIYLYSQPSANKSQFLQSLSLIVKPAS